MNISNKLQKTYNILEKSIKKDDIPKLKKAFIFANKNYCLEKNNNGDFIINHVLKASLLLIKISNNIDLVVSCLLEDILIYSTEKEVQKEFGEEITKLVNNVTKISNIKYNQGKTKKNLALFHNIFQKSGNDIRIFLIKICLRVDYIENFGILLDERKKYIATETLDIYIPLIKMFNLSKFFPNIEDLCYKFIKPQEYKNIEEILLKKKVFFTKKIKNIKKSLEKIAKKNKIEIKIESRIKSIYSIYKKMENKKILFSGIYDLIALRVITEKKREAYLFLGLIHSIFKSKDNKIKDYISSPKSNGYQSIHTTVSDSDGYIFEIQIQTKEMYEFNIFGLASHNGYKGLIEKSNIFPEWMEKYYSKQKEGLFSNNFINSFDISIFTDEITCFTSTLDPIELPTNSTVLDFGFKIHTKIGNRITGAWINGEYIENLIHILKNGDKVHLSLAEKEVKYPVKYISSLKTKTAKKNLKKSFKNESISKIKSLGKFLLNEKMELFGYKSFEKLPVIIQNKVLHSFKSDNIEKLYLNIGNGKILIEKLLDIIYNLKDDDTKYKSIVGLKVIFKQKSPDNINALFKVFHNLNINIVNINYKGIHTDAEINVKNLGLLKDLLVEISRTPNVQRVKRIMSSKLKVFIAALLVSSIWIILSPFLLLLIENNSNFSETVYKSIFYINIIFFISLLYFFKYTVKATLSGLIKQNIFWIAMFILNTFILASVIWESIYIFNDTNSVFLFSLVLLLYGLTLFEYLDNKFINKK